MHVGPCGASNGSRIAAPRIAPACAFVTRLHGVKLLRTCDDWRCTRLLYPGACFVELDPSLPRLAESTWRLAWSGLSGLPGVAADVESPPPQPVSAVATATRPTRPRVRGFMFTLPRGRTTRPPSSCRH